MSHALDREVRLALWKIHILHHAAKRPVYGLWMMEELAALGHRVSPGTLYPILARMEANGWLVSAAPGSSRARRNYRITAAGRTVLAVLGREITELYREVIGGLEPHHGARRARSPRKADAPPRRSRAVNTPAPARSGSTSHARST